MTVVELVVSMVVLLVAVGGTMGAISSFVVLGDSSRETTRAYLEAQRIMEELRAENFEEIFAAYNGTSADDPATAYGDDFDVDGFTAQADDADGRVGLILFPTDAAAPGVLREDLDAAEFGLPRDLNADGVIDSDDRSGDYLLLPVRVRIEWRGRSGNRFIELQTILRGI